MAHLLEPARYQELVTRVNNLQANSPRQWGKMDPAQMLNHCNLGFDVALGRTQYKQPFFAKIIGPLFKKNWVQGDKPFGKNAPTMPSIKQTQPVDGFDDKKQILLKNLEQFVQNGLQPLEGKVHSFFGKLTPEEWATLQYKHLDHHLRQFGV
jgi:hypothetical protein